MKIPGIKEFPTDEKIWRIDWIGEVDLNPSVPSEPSLKIIVSPLVDEKADPFSNNSVVHTERRVLKIGVGQFPLMEIGSLWKKGYPVNRETEKTKALDGLHINSSTVRSVATDHQEGGEWMIPSQCHRVGKYGFPSRCLCIAHKGDSYSDTEIAPLSLDAQRVRDKALQASFENFIQMIHRLNNFVTRGKREKGFPPLTFRRLDFLLYPVIP